MRTVLPAGKRASPALSEGRNGSRSRSFHGLPPSPALLSGLLLVSFLKTGCGPTISPMDWPEEHCPSEHEVEGIAGRVLMGENPPGVEGIRVSLFFEDPSIVPEVVPASDSNVLERDSVFRFVDVPDGKHRLRACLSTYSAEKEVEVTAGKSSFLCLRLLPGTCPD